VQYYTKVKFKKDTDTFLNIEFNSQIRSLKALLLLFIEPHAAGARDSEKFIFPDLTKVSVTVNGSPNMLYNNGIEDIDMWREPNRMFAKEKNGTDHMDMTKFYTGDKFGLVIDMNSHSGIQLQIYRKGEGSGNVECHVFVIPDAHSTLWTDSLFLCCIE